MGCVWAGCGWSRTFKHLWVLTRLRTVTITIATTHSIKSVRSVRHVPAYIHKNARNFTFFFVPFRLVLVSNEFDFSLLAVFGARRQHSALVRGMCVCNASDDNNQPKKKNERIAEPDSNDWGPVIEVEPLETNEHVHAVPSQQNAPPHVQYCRCQ